jgi:outer membrane murein-binding lipoprotein Lpp
MQRIVFSSLIAIGLCACAPQSDSDLQAKYDQAVAESETLKATNQALEAKVEELQNIQTDASEEDVQQNVENVLGTWCKAGIFLDIVEIGEKEYVKRIRTGERVFDETLRRSSDGQFHMNNSAKTFYAIRPNVLEVRTRHGFDGVLYPPSEQSTDAECIPVK